MPQEDRRKQIGKELEELLKSLIARADMGNGVNHYPYPHPLDKDIARVRRIQELLKDEILCR